MRNGVGTVGRRCGRDALLFANPRKETGKGFLDGFETRPRSGCCNVVRPGDAALTPVLGPCLLLPAQVTSNPGNGDQRPETGPSEGK